MQAHAGLILGGNYELELPLGKGGMGEVWRARARDLNAPVALKLLLENVATPLGRARFEQEAMAAAALRSPHVVQVLGCGVDAGTGIAFIVLELLEGETLRQRLARQGRLSWAETQRWVVHITRALTRAHAAGIVHRDLKPENVFLIGNGDEELAKVLDFGIAKQASSTARTATGKVLGTVHYMSPEQLDGLSVDHRADLWSLALLTAECLTGARAVEGGSFAEVAMRVALGRLQTPSSLAPVPAGFDEWFARGTRRQPEERFASAEELAQSLLRLSSSPALAGPEPPGVPLAHTLVESDAPLPGKLPGERAAASDSVEASSRQASSASPGRRQFVWALAGGALVLGGIVWTSLRSVQSTGAPPTARQAALSPAPPAAVPERASEVESPSVAVLPFEVVADSESARFFADGVHSDLLIRLGGIAGLRVASRDVVQRYRGSSASPAQITSELGVASVVSTRLEVRGEQATWHVQLQGADAAVLWSHSYERPLADAMGLLSALAGDLAGALSAHLRPAERQRLSSPPSASSRAYQLYLEAQSDSVAPPEKERLLREALTLDSEFVPAWLDLAWVHSNNYQWHIRRTPAEREAAAFALGKAEALAPDDPAVRMQVAWSYGAMYRDWARAYRALAALAKELPNNGSLQYQLSRVAERRGDPERAITHMSRAWELEPAQDEYGWWLAFDQASLRHYDEARQTLQRVQHSYFYGETGRDFDLARLAFQQSGQKDALLAWERSLTPEVRQRQAVRDLLGNLAWDLADRDRYIERAASPGDVQVDAPLRELYLAIALLDRGETQRAQQRVEQVEQKLRQEVAEQPENAPSHARLGLALALRGGQRELALKHAKQAVRLVPQEADGYSAPQLRAAYACTLTWLGEREAAVKELELLTRRPYPENHSFFFPVHVEHLKVGLEWKPLHGLPAFEALLRAPETRAPL
ncbi:MAG: hypothetical protein RL685_3242 [Pseudomonadota bacterium]|jgi:serine/threonine-protein kinase